ncbi:MAG: DUF2892 domain-containing protein [Nanoarchaeota archaeon]
MICNVGKTDKVLRVIIAIIVTAIAASMNIMWLYIVAALLVITAVTGYCALYQIFKISTAAKKEAPKKVVAKKAVNKPAKKAAKKKKK